VCASEGEREREREGNLHIPIPSCKLKEEDSERENVFGGVEKKAGEAFQVVGEESERANKPRQRENTLPPFPLHLLSSLVQEILE
jgi:hypothetical protein